MAICACLSVTWPFWAASVNGVVQLHGSLVGAAQTLVSVQAAGTSCCLLILIPWLRGGARGLLSNSLGEVLALMGTDHTWSSWLGVRFDCASVSSAASTHTCDRDISETREAVTKHADHRVNTSHSSSSSSPKTLHMPSYAQQLHMLYKKNLNRFRPCLITFDNL